jgi:hypothetical protein
MVRIRLWGKAGFGQKLGHGGNGADGLNHYWVIVEAFPQ